MKNDYKTRDVLACIALVNEAYAFSGPYDVDRALPRNNYVVIDTAPNLFLLIRSFWSCHLDPTGQYLHIITCDCNAIADPSLRDVSSIVIMLKVALTLTLL